jgi:putative SOS response-associated peptidase YedK
MSSLYPTFRIILKNKGSDRPGRPSAGPPAAICQAPLHRPMDRFHERDKGRKQHAFGMKDGGLFGVAGIWENWRNQDGAWELTFCMITVAANELIATIHDRMPAIIPIEHHMRWLGPEPDPRNLLKPFLADQLKIFRRPH